MKAPLVNAQRRLTSLAGEIWTWVASVTPGQKEMG